MDKIDHKILKILSKNARTSFKKISQDIGLTSPAVKNRIEKMEQEGIIKGYSLIVDKENIGYMITAFISIAMESHLKSEFFSFVDECPNIVECYGITGEYFALLKVHFASTMDLENFLISIQRFGETSTNIVLSMYKDSSGWIESL